MYGIQKIFREVSFPVDVFEKSITAFEKKIKSENSKEPRYSCDFEDKNREISIKQPVPFYRQQCFSSKYFYFSGVSENFDGRITFRYNESTLSVSLQDLSSLESAEEILHEFDKSYGSSKIPIEATLKSIKIFIGHGRSPLWRDLKDHLQDKHGMEVIAYETGARGGLTIQEILHDLSSRASLALMIHTGEDIDESGLSHARENVVHETGLFQGKLGIKRAIVILEDGTSEFSNIAGLQQVRFQKGNIKETFGEVLAILRREFVTKG